MDTDTVFRVCKEMMVSRGYTIYDENWVRYILKAYRPDRVKVVLFITPFTKFNIDVIKYYYTLLTRKHIQHAIIVYHDGLTSSVLKIIDNIDKKIEMFHIDDLSFNILNHELVPKHEKIGHKKHNDEKLPIIRKTDPVVRFMGFGTGDILKIHRTDGTLYYRYVK